MLQKQDRVVCGARNYPLVQIPLLIPGHVVRHCVRAEPTSNDLD
jgi:hypothetical protein